MIKVPGTAFKASDSSTYGKIIPRSCDPNSTETDELVTSVLVPGLIITCAKTMVENKTCSYPKANVCRMDNFCDGKEVECDSACGTITTQSVAEHCNCPCDPEKDKDCESSIYKKQNTKYI